MSPFKYVRLTTFGKIFPVFLIVGIIGGIQVYNFVMNPVRALYQAFDEMDIEKLEWAIEHGVDVDTFVQNVRPVALALKEGRYDFMETIAAAGATLDLNTRNGSFVGEVTRSGDTVALHILGRHGANFHINADTSGHNALTYAITAGRQTLIPILMQYVERNARDGNGKTPLHYAGNMDDDLIQHMVEAGENPNATDKHGNTPMHTVNSFRAVKTLHLLGADVNVINDCNTPAIFHQVANGNGRTYNYMVANGAMTDRIDGYDQSILTYALMTDNELLHRQVSDDFCKFHPETCAVQQEKLKSTAIRAVATLVYTKTIHKVAMQRLASSQAAKQAIKGASRRAIGKKVLLRGVPLLGWAMTIYDGMKLADAIAEQDRIIRENREEADRLQQEREIAVQRLRDEYMDCHGYKEASAPSTDEEVTL